MEPLEPLVSWLACVGPLSRKTQAGFASKSKEVLPPTIVRRFQDVNPALLAALRRHRLTPLVYWRLSQGEAWGEVHPDWRAALAHDYALALREGARQEQEAGEVVAALEAAGIEVILLKGADLRLRLYGDPALRPMTDLDLLVAQTQVGRARTALRDLGYRLSPLCRDPLPGFRDRFANEIMFEPSGSRRLPIDLHWELWGGAGFYRLPFPPLAASAEQIDFHGAPAPVLSPEHTVIHLCLHLFEDFYGVIQLIDLLGFLGAHGLDWRVFRAEAGRFPCQGPVGLVLRRVETLAPGLIPPVVLADLASYRPTTFENLILTRKLGYLTGYFPLFRHYSVGSWLFYLAAKLWPDRHYLRESLRLPSRAAYLRQFFRKLL